MMDGVFLRGFLLVVVVFSDLLLIVGLSVQCLRVLYFGGAAPSRCKSKLYFGNRPSAVLFAVVLSFVAADRRSSFLL